MFLTQVKSFPKKEWWRYILGFLVIALSYSLGQIPLVLAWIEKIGLEEVQNTPQRDLMGILDNNSTLFFSLLFFVFAFFGVLIALQIHSQSLKQLVTGRNSISWKRVLFSFSILAVFLVVSTIIDYKINPEDYIWNFQLQPFIILLGIVVVLLPIQTSVEELVFRGYLMQGFTSITQTRWVPLILTSLIFGVMHFGNPEVEELGIYAKIFYIGTGLFLGVLTLMDDGMELALGFHAANNLITALLVTADYTVIQTPAIIKQIVKPEAGLTVLMPLLIMYPILLFVFAKKYKWTNWKQRLLGTL